MFGVLTENCQINLFLQRLIRDCVAGLASQARLIVAWRYFEAISAGRITSRRRVLTHDLPIIFVPYQLCWRIAAIGATHELHLLAVPELLALAVALDEGLARRLQHRHLHRRLHGMIGR